MIEATILHPADDELGFLGWIVIGGDAIYAVGGTYYKPTLLCSRDRGASFARWHLPKSSGLRNLCLVDGAVWIIGEYGLVAHTRDDGVTWRRTTLPEAGRSSCLYGIARDADGGFWITGDDGLVFRRKPGARSTFTAIPTNTKGRMLYLWLDPKDGVPWVVDTTGTIQRFDRKKSKFVVCEAPALKKKHPLNRMIRTPGQAMLVIGNGGTILRSSNDGATWKKIVTRTRADLATVCVTPFGIIAVGFQGTMLISHDDGRSFQPVTSSLTGRLWSIADIGDGLLIGSDEGLIYRIPNTELAKLLQAAHASDQTLGALAQNVRDGVEGAMLVLADALRERGLY